MASTRCLEFLLFLLCHHVRSEDPEPMFRTQGNNIELGYCFGVDYIAVYRSSPEGDQLLGNSSESITPVTLPADLQGRVHINKQQFLLGLQILNLTLVDSAIYRKECWENQTLVTQLTQQLFVCDEEIESEEIIVREEEQWTELLCDSASIGLEGTSVRWYREMYPSYKPTLILDSSVLLEPLVEDLRNRSKVRNNGALLALHYELLNNNQQYYCLVFKGKNCLTFQNMYLPVLSESREIYASAGDGLVLYCPSNGHNQQWDTPLGNINGSSMTQNLQIRTEDKDFSLVIPSVSDEHSGHYSCISSSIEIQYSLGLCAKKDPLPPQKVDTGQSVTIGCDVDPDGQRVQWYRRQWREHVAELIHDTNNDTVSIPEDLWGRLTLSKSGSSLEISNSVMDDGGVYSCVVLREPEFVLLDYDSDYNESFTAVEEDESDWEEPLTCIFKQDTFLTVRPTPEPLPPPNATPYVLAGLIGLVLLVGLIIAVILVKRKVQRRKAAESNQDTNKTDDPTRRRMLGGEE